MPNTTKPAAVESETRTTTGNLALAPPIGQPILTGSRAIPNNAPLIKRLLNIRLDDHVAKLILVTAGAYCNPWAGEDGGVCLAANRTLWELAEVGRTTFIAKWRKLKSLGLVHVRRRGPGKTAEIIIRTGSPRLLEVSAPDTSRSVGSRHLYVKDLDLGSVRSDAAASTPLARETDPPAAAATTRRIEGLIAYLAVNSRALEHRFSEGRVREALAAGRITVSDLQRQADELRARAGEAAAAQALERSGGHAAVFKCGACGTMQYPKPGGLCPGCGEAMRR